jgi:hypothetical protein
MLSSGAATAASVTTSNYAAVMQELQHIMHEITVQLLPGDAPPDTALRTQAEAYDAQLRQLTLVTAQPTVQDVQQAEQLQWRIKRLANAVFARAKQPTAAFGLATADSMTLAYPRDFPFIPAAPELSLAKGEYENIQVIVIPYDVPLKDVGARITAIVGPDGNAVLDEQLTAVVAPLGSVRIWSSRFYDLPALANSAPGYQGWIPDPIRSDLTTVDVAVGDFQPFWIELYANPHAQPGLYRITVTFSAAGLPEQSLEISAQVWPFTIPDRPKLATSMTWNPLVLDNIYYFRTFSQREEMIDQYHDFMETFKIEPDSIYRWNPPTVEQLLKIKEKWGLRQFCVYYIYPVTNFDINQPQTWQPKIDEILDIIGKAMAEYEQAGLAEYAYIYGFDESRSEYFPLARTILKQVKERFPSVPVMTTLIDGSLGITSDLAGLIDIWVPGVHQFNTEARKAAQALGEQVYWYIHVSVRSPYPNWFNGYQPSDTRVLLGPLSHKYNVDGFLYYNITRWSAAQGIMYDGIFSNWDARTYQDASGDGSLFYPGRFGPLASQRLQNYRDGMEDYNLLVELQNRVDRITTAPSELISHAEELLAADAVAASTREYTKDAALYRQWRNEVAEAIIRFDTIDPTVAEQTAVGPKEYASGRRPVSIADVDATLYAKRLETTQKVWFKQPNQPSPFTKPFDVEIFIPPTMPVKAWTVTLNEQELYAGVEIPNEPLGTLDLSDGFYHLHLKVTEESGQVWRSSLHFAVQTGEITHPERGARVKGVVPISVAANVASNAITEASVTITPVAEGELVESETLLLYRSSVLPIEPIMLDTLSLRDGTYALTFTARKQDGNTMGNSINIRIENWAILLDEFKPPIDSGWFGLIEQDLTRFASEGWDYDQADATHFFGDVDRRVWTGTGVGYLVWEAPQAHNVKVTLYSRRENLSSFSLSVSVDEQTWLEQPWTQKTLGRSAGGWYKIEIESDIEITSANYVRLGLSDELNAANAQLGVVEIISLIP